MRGVVYFNEPRCKELGLDYEMSPGKYRDTIVAADKLRHVGERLDDRHAQMVRSFTENKEVVRLRYQPMAPGWFVLMEDGL